VLAAEPGDHGAPPSGGAGVVIEHIPWFFDGVLGISQDPVENIPALADGPTGSGVLEVGLSRGEAGEAAARAGVVEMDDGADERKKLGEVRDGLVWVEDRVDGALEGADAVFDGSIIGRAAHRAVERDDELGSEEAIEDGRIEGSAVVTFEDERRPVALAEGVEPVAVGRSGLGLEDKRFEVEVGGEVAGQDDDEAWRGRRGFKVEGVDGPGEVGQVPGDAERGAAEAALVRAAQAADDGLEAPAGDGLLEGADEGARVAGALRPEVEVRDP
jgi:hypothetical protein